MASELVWVRRRADDDWRMLNVAGAVATFVFLWVAVVSGDWPWALFVGMLFTNMLQRAFSGLLVGKRYAVQLRPFAIPLWLRIDTVTTVEIVGNRKLAGVRMWAGGKPHRVWRVRVSNDHSSSRDVALLVVEALRQRGSPAGLHDAVTDEWLVPPAGAEPDSTGRRVAPACSALVDEADRRFSYGTRGTRATLISSDRYRLEVAACQTSSSVTWTHRHSLASTRLRSARV